MEFDELIPKDIPSAAFDRFKSDDTDQVDQARAVFQAWFEGDGEISRRVRIPGEKSSAEDWSSFYDQAGRPEKADGYALPDSLEEHQKAGAESLRKSAHAAGVSAKGFDGLLTAQLETVSKARQAAFGSVAARQDEWAEAIRKEHGDKLDGLLPVVHRVVDTLTEGDAEQKKALESILNPHLFNVLSTLGANAMSILDDTVPQDSAPEGPETAKAQLIEDYEALIQTHREADKGSKHSIQIAALDRKIVALGNKLRGLGVDTKAIIKGESYIF